MIQVAEISIKSPKQDEGSFSSSRQRDTKKSLGDTRPGSNQGALESKFFDANTIVSDDIIGVYLKEISRVPLLTAVDEIALAKRLEKGRQAEKVLQSVTVEPEQAQALMDYIREGKAARDQLIKANTRLVVSIAKKYIGQGLTLLDLIQEGNVGLMKAVEKYDHRRQLRFSTYATWWIRQAVARALASQGRMIRLPDRLGHLLRKLHRVSSEYEQTWGRKPCLEECALALGLKPSEVLWMLRLDFPQVSLEQPLLDGKHEELGDYIEDENIPAPPEVVDRVILQEKLEDLLSILTPREAKVLSLRYGLLDGQSHTLAEIGKQFGLTRERIRQIEIEALEKLRYLPHSQQLRVYLN